MFRCGQWPRSVAAQCGPGRTAPHNARPRGRSGAGRIAEARQPPHRWEGGLEKALNPLQPKSATPRPRPRPRPAVPDAAAPARPCCHLSAVPSLPFPPRSPVRCRGCPGAMPYGTGVQAGLSSSSSRRTGLRGSCRPRRETHSAPGSCRQG